MRKTVNETTIVGNGHEIEIEYKQPDWNEEEEDREEEACFQYKGNTYFLSEIMSFHNTVHCPDPPKEFEGFDGYLGETYFSGIVVKISSCGDSVRAYRYYS